MAQQNQNRKKIIRFAIIGTLLIIAGIYAYNKISFATTHESTDNAQVETQITPVLTRVPGYIKTISVRDYDSVHEGQLLVELDDAELQTQLMQMEADFRAAEADILNARAAVNNANVSLKGNRGNISLAEVKKQQAEADYNRNQNLFNDQAITKKQLEDSRFALEQAQQQYINSQSDLGTAGSRIAVLQASIQKAIASLDVKRAAIEQQKLKLSYTKIVSPVTGKLGKSNVSIGQFVQAGAPLFAVVNDSVYWITANFKETQIRKFHPGTEAHITLDAYPDVEITGTIESLSEATGAKFSLLPPDNSSGNFVKVAQRVPVKIHINNVDKIRELLRAGLSAEVVVPISK